MDMFALQTIKYVCSLWPYYGQAEASHDKKNTNWVEKLSLGFYVIFCLFVQLQILMNQGWQ